ncbi:hypothetical protein AND_002769, partial [Anopheles darlingi]
MLTPKIMRQDTVMRKAISSRDKLIVTLRYLASGVDYKTLEFKFRISAQSISIFIPQVCMNLVNLLRDYVK